MKALIIAAGKGTRLRMLAKDRPKPLVRLLGLSLIERVILTARESGINEFVIVIGYLGDKIKEKLGDGRDYKVKIEYVENEEWERGNGVSVLKAKKHFKENFVLLMADHIFDASILKRLKKIDLNENECILVVDKSPQEYIDLGDATKVKTKDGYIQDIGKKIKDYNCIDCGIFFLSPSIFKALEESIEHGDETLSGGIRVLARKGKMKSFDVNDNFWIDIDTVSSYKAAEKILCKRLLKKTDGPVSRYLNRPLSIRISKILVRFNIKPNLISLISFGISFLAFLLFCLGDYLYVATGGILSQISSIVDGCDGEVARLKFQGSKYGAWFDAVLDRYADALIILGMVYGWWSIHSEVCIWIVGFFAMMGSFMNSYTAIKYDEVLLRKRENVRVGRDLRLFLIMVGALLGQIYYTLFVLGVLTNFVSLRRIFLLKKYKEVLNE
ncbi:MAG TPA: nucleotidyl transferase [Candidatus Aerophobetes bacterium]|uniref:Bifunctional IPC transferase and DIPP synthase n=1 Tax=Aerophobetes bacterium TaxID=2030807 RepID=A0A7V5HYF5_UNCAE|nr:nucleotidyl transferase [Candidatus Aerophobetes bacterium]